VFSDLPFFATFPNPYLSLLSITRGDYRMIRERINSPTIRAVSYNHTSSELIKKNPKKDRLPGMRPYPKTYTRRLLLHGFREKIYRHFITDHVIPAAAE
jgi:hypothetical protein